MHYVTAKIVSPCQPGGNTVPPLSITLFLEKVALILDSSTKDARSCPRCFQ